MNCNKYGGIFITFDGPNGSGKTTIIDSVRDKLLMLGRDVLVTKEPTESGLGNYVRESSEKFSGNTLACLVAADRYRHIEATIEPALRSGKTVLCDRYLVSSLILQSMDGVNTKFIEDINSEVLMPDIFILLTACAETIRSRLNARSVLTRFETGNQTEMELDKLSSAEHIISSYPAKVFKFCTDNPIDETVDSIVEKIIAERNVPHE